MTLRIDQPAPVRSGEELDADRLGRYLDDCSEQLLAMLAESHVASEASPHAADGLSVMQFPRGYSNLTYHLVWRGFPLVLRRPPFGNQVRTAHDMGREYRVLQSLSRVYPPAPRPWLYCDDLSVIGSDFYLMQRQTGVILRGPNPPQLLQDDPQKMTRMCESFIDNLAQLHEIDYSAAGLSDLGKPVGYVQRQISGWRKRYEQARTSDLRSMEELGRWLEEHQPREGTATLLHNDYKYDNLILDPNQLSRIVAVLDWEMATLGDPWMDVGTTLAYWVEATDAPELLAQAFGPTMATGSLTRQQLVDRYLQRRGIPAVNPLFYYCFGLFKLAVIVQQIYARYVRGNTHDPRFAHLDRTVATLGNSAADAIARRAI